VRGWVQRWRPQLAAERTEFVSGLAWLEKH